MANQSNRRFIVILSYAFTYVMNALKREEGQTFVEYTLIGVLVAVAVAAVMSDFTGAITGALSSIEGAFN